MKVGDYVRTKTGIHKIFKINENATVWKYYCDKKPTGDWDSSYEYIKIKDDVIIKSSPNIIDLVFKDDFVNGYRVAEIETLPTKQKLVVVGYGYDADEISENNIKSIVTKEQFESMEYKL